MRSLRVLAVAVVASLLVPAAAAAKVTLLGVTSPARPGATATLTVAVTPAAATCSIRVVYKSGPSKAQGLVPKRAAAGKVSWSWTVGTRTTPGRWPIHVDCGAAGKLSTAFEVRR